MDDKELNEIEARANAATSGPWPETVWYGEEGGHASVGPHHNSDDPEEDDDWGKAELDAKFISHARTDVPKLVAEVRRLEDTIGSLVRQITTLKMGIK